jgi:cysteine-rich repeat protein
MPICGDGRMVGWETCDDGNTQDGDGCASYCLVETCWDCSRGACVYQPCDAGWAEAGRPMCGDGIVSPGEECDNGNQNSDMEYGGCTTQCRFGAFCGDGIKNGTEECDDRVNEGSYGGCTPGCTLASYCGDGKVDSAFGEQCDLGPLNGATNTLSNFCDSTCHAFIE